MSIAKDLVLVTVFLTITMLFIVTVNDFWIYFSLIVLGFYSFIKYINLKKELEDEREYFIKTLSHDLKVSTIAQIRGLDLLEKSSLTDIELTKNINESAKYTLDMITMLLNNYRYKNGEQVLNYEKFNLTESILFCIRMFQEKAYEKEIQLHYNLEKISSIEADKEEIEKVIKTIISTSIFYGKNNSSINIKLNKDSNNYIINIIYQGKSLTDEECRRMFSKNPRFSTVGHGIKMHLCKNIIEYHGGKIKVENYSKGYNSFTFSIPVSKKEIVARPSILSTLQPHSS